MTAQLTVDVLRGLGHDAVLVQDGEETATSADVVFMGGCVNWYPRTWRQLGRGRTGRPRTVLWHTEPLPLPSAAGLRPERLHTRELAKVILRDPRRSDPRSNVAGLRRVLRSGLLDALVVSTFERKLFLAEQGLDVAFVPIGYDRAIHGSPNGSLRDIDVLFLGALDVPRRRRIFERLRSDGVAVRALGSWTDASLWGESRIKLLNRTKILLNLPRHAGMLSGGRMLLGMANKTLLVAEPIFEPRPYVPGKHFVSSPLDEMAGTIGRYLADDGSRNAITAAAYELITKELTTQRSFSRIAELF
jgi:hypothetical protein